MAIESALKELRNALLDLQAADYNTYERPLQRMARVFQDPALKPFADALRSSVHFDAWLESADDGASMAGSARLNWPADRAQELGLALVMIERGGADPRWFLDVAHTYYYSGAKIVGDIRKITTSVVMPFVRDFTSHVTERATPAATTTSALPVIVGGNRVFIVHGHDEAVLQNVARFVSDVGLEPVILHEQANRGMTIPEKLAANAKVGFAIVLLTPDDKGGAREATELMPRARQNVLLELGYFVALLGRDRVCAMRKDDVEIPSDMVGVVYTPYDAHGGWRHKLALELRSAGYEIDLNRLKG